MMLLLGVLCWRDLVVATPPSLSHDEAAGSGTREASPSGPSTGFLTPDPLEGGFLTPEDSPSSPISRSSVFSLVKGSANAASSPALKALVAARDEQWEALDSFPPLNPPLDCAEVVKKEDGSGERCVLNQTIRSDRDLSLIFQGDIEVTGHLSARRGIRIEADNGSVRIHEKANLESEKELRLKGTWVTFEELSAVKATTTIEATAGQGDDMKVVLRDDARLHSVEATVILRGGKVEIVDRAQVCAHTSIVLGGAGGLPQARRLARHRSRSLPGRPALADALRCEGPSCIISGDVNVSGQATLDTAGPVSMQTNSVFFGPNISVRASTIVVKAASQVHLNVSTLPGTKEGTWQVYPPMEVMVSTPGPLVLGSREGTWSVKRLTAAAGKISVQGAYLQVAVGSSNSCNNKRTAKDDICQALIANWSDDPDRAEEAARAATADRNVTFDFVLIAGDGNLYIGAQSTKASSMLVCSHQEVHLGAGTLLDVSGRGCGPGRGVSPGTTEQRCGGAGGTLVAMGGYGATYDTAAVTICALPTAQRGSDDHLPTLGASGGGCGIEWSICKDLGSGNVYVPAAGGGLIWVSGAAVKLGPGAMLKANGMKGVVYQGSSQQKTNGISVAGGGAGGQILLYTPLLEGDRDFPALLSAEGGGAMCTKQRVGGGGSGGFVGFRNYGTPQEAGSNTTRFNVSGGWLTDECKSLEVLENSNALMGKEGKTLSLDACKPGHSGLFCLGCAVGKYSQDGGRECMKCKTKPATEMAEYFETHWPNSSCPYRCLPGVPNVKVNPFCEESLPYVIQFFGGLWGGVSIGVSFVLVSIFLAWRRFHKAARRVSVWSSWTIVDASPWGWWRIIFGLTTQPVPQARPGVGSTPHSRAVRNGVLRFTTEQLPYHLHRVYLGGTNSFRRPWILDKAVPASLNSMVAEVAWEGLASMLAIASRVPKFERCVENFLRFAYPPLADACVLHFRRKRAVRVRDLVSRIAESGVGGWVLWNAMYGGPEPAELAVAFGCDDGTTLGYLDFFDFSRSQYDWAPVDLRHEVRLLVAHGDGSYSSPFALDIQDPLVQHLSQTDFGAHAVCSVISTFNRIARLVRKEDLLTSNGHAYGPMLRRLRSKVEQCAARCGLSGYVKVLTVMHYGVSETLPRVSPRRARSAVSPTNGSFWDLIPGTQDDMQDFPRDPSPRRQHRPDFSSLPSPRQEVYPYPRTLANAPRGPTSDFVTTSNSFDAMSTSTDRAPSPRNHFRLDPVRPQDLKSIITQEHMSSNEHGSGAMLRADSCVHMSSGFSRPDGKGEVSLCLAFTDCASLMAVGQRHCSGGLAAPVPSSLTSPMSQQELIEHVAFADLAPPDTDELDALEACTRRWWRALAWRDHANRAPLASVLALAFLLFADLMGFILAGAMLYAVAPLALGFYVLLPPLAQPLALVIGPVFVLSENPWIGRLYGAVQIFSVAGPATMALVLAFLLQVDSWAFDLLAMVSICVIKLALYVIAHFHIANLEAAYDLRFADASQADFLGRILAPGNSQRPQAWTLDHIDEGFGRDELPDTPSRDHTVGTWGSREGGMPSADSASSLHVARDFSSGNLHGLRSSQSSCSPGPAPF